MWHKKKLVETGVRWLCCAVFWKREYLVVLKISTKIFGLLPWHQWLPLTPVWSRQTPQTWNKSSFIFFIIIWEFFFFYSSSFVHITAFSNTLRLWLSSRPDWLFSHIKHWFSFILTIAIAPFTRIWICNTEAQRTN